MSKASIWSRLKAKGFSDAACASIMGNMGPESLFQSNNVEDRYHNDTGRSDEYYTNAVDNGSYSRNDFIHDGGKAYGYGLCQWTYYTRKAGLYDFAKNRGVSIADEQMQIDWMWEELHTSEFRSVLNMLLSDASMREMTKKFLISFENPDDKSEGVINYRYEVACEVYAEFAGTVPATPESNQDPCASTPRGTLRKGVSGEDVKQLQKVLIELGYDVGPDGADGIFGNNTYKAVVKFQEDHGIYANGEVEPLTYAALNDAISEATEGSEEPDISGGATGIPPPVFWPPRGYRGGQEDPGLCLGMSGADVEFLCATLKTRGYGINYVNSNFTDTVDSVVREYQRANSLDVDGIVGMHTWRSLLTM